VVAASELAMHNGDRNAAFRMRGEAHALYSEASQQKDKAFEASLLINALTRLQNYLTTGDPVQSGKADID